MSSPVRSPNKVPTAPKPLPRRLPEAAIKPAQQAVAASSFSKEQLDKMQQQLLHNAKIVNNPPPSSPNC